MLIKIRYPSTVTIIILNKPDEYLMILRKKKSIKAITNISPFLPTVWCTF